MEATAQSTEQQPLPNIVKILIYSKLRTYMAG